MSTSQFILKKFADFIYESTGIFYNEAKYYQLESRLAEIAKKYDCRSIIELVDNKKCFDDVQIKNVILDMATNNETFFFRDKEIFTTIADTLIPEMWKNISGSQSFKIWSSACSTGQEPYSLAMILSEVEQKIPDFKFNINATDFSKSALDKARSGKYFQVDVNRGLTSDDLDKYFDCFETDEGKEKSYWSIKDEYKKNIRFDSINLKDPFPLYRGFHIVLCRNVLIYQKPDAKREILQRIHKAMHENGILFLGGTENIIDMPDYFSQKKIGNTMYFIKK